MCRSAGLVLTLCLATVTAKAALLSRAGGEAYYDDGLNITWLADANYARTSGYDGDGRMPWSEAQDWIATLNARNGGLGYLGVNDWRLPKVTDTGTPGCNPGFFGTDCGTNLDLATGEMAHMYYSTLGNTAFYDRNGVVTACGIPYPYNCKTNDGPFANLQADGYWYGTENVANPENAWAFGFDAGNQYDAYGPNNDYYAWAVRSGDIAVVPAPSALWLLGTALGAMNLWRRRIST